MHARLDIRVMPRSPKNRIDGIVVTFTDITDQPEINLCSSTYLLTSNVDLNYVCVRRVELLVGKISTKH